MSKRGLPVDIKMRHDAHYVEELSRPNRSVGKILPINQVEPNPEQPAMVIDSVTVVRLLLIFLAISSCV